MNSPFANLLLKLQSRIAAISGSPIRFIDHDWNQLEQESPPVSFPCVLVDFTDTKFDQMQGYQHGNVLCRLRLAVNTFTSTAQITDLSIREEALDFYEIEQQLYEALQAWDADGLLVNDLIRVSASTEKRSDGLRVRVIDFQCTFQDATVTG